VYPRLLQFGSFTLPTEGACLAVGLLVALILGQAAARRLQIAQETMWNLSMTAVVAALLGAKLTLILSSGRVFLHYPLLVLSLSVLRSPAARWGGLLAAMLAALVALRFQRMPLLRTLDAAAPALALGDAFANLGAFATGAQYGAPTALPWGVIYHSRWAALWAGTPLGVRLHPVQLYLCGLDLLLCALLWWLLLQALRSGEVFGAGLFLYGLALYGVELLRGEVPFVLLHGALSIQQAIAVGMVLTGALLWLERPAPEPRSQARGIHVV
jgi:phosphatidylglycerol:prolipoprotein diacylglycerol transferase